MENYVMTVSREYGSDGCAIAERLAKELNIRYLDEELLSIVSEESGVSEELLIQADEKVKRKLWEGTGTGNTIWTTTATTRATRFPSITCSATRRIPSAVWRTRSLS